MTQEELKELSDRLDENIRKVSDPHTKHIEIYKNKLREMANLVGKLQTENINLQEKLSEVLMLLDEPIETPKWALPAKGAVKQSHNAPVLLVSDLHYGENVNPKEVNGFNSYCPTIAELRWNKLIENTILKTRTKGKRPNGIVVCFLGDDISGDIHDELRETNFLTPTDSVLDVAKMRTQMLKAFEAEYGNVWAVSVMGNHGRTTQKVRSKGCASLNFDTLIARIVAQQFEGKKNFTFTTPKSGEAYLDINKHKFLAMHGDKIGCRGGQGFIGPSAPIGRGQSKTRTSYFATKEPVDWILIGHFHVPMMLEHVIANGTLVGYSQYAKDLKAEPAYPSQTLFYVDETYGMTDYSRIYVTDPKQIETEKKLYFSHPVHVNMHVDNKLVAKIKEKQKTR